MTTVVNDDQQTNGALTAGLPTTLPLFGSFSEFMSMVWGSLLSGDPLGGDGGNGGVVLSARRAASGPPTNAPFTVIGCFDFGGATRIREITYGGGQWGSPDASTHLFYAADPTNEAVDTGVLMFGIDYRGVVTVTKDEGADPDGGIFQVRKSNNGVAIEQTETGAENIFEGNIVTGGSHRQLGTLTPAAALIGTVNDYVPAEGLSNVRRLRLTLDAETDLTGIGELEGGTMLTIHNYAGGFNLILFSDSSSSSAGNRLLFPSSSLMVAPNGSATFWYDDQSAAWRLESIV